MVNVKTISIIVVTLNEAAHIQQLMSSIDRLERPSDLALETILIDGGSTDGTADAAHKADFAKLIVIEGASIPACRNRGLAEARGGIIAFLDGDCEPATDWLVNALPHLEGAEPVIIGWPVKPPTPGTWVQRAWHTHWMFKNRAATSNEPVREEAFRLITTRNMLLTRSAADQLGGFDENLLTGEDTDYVFRAYTAGIRVLGVPALTVVHHGEPKTLRDFFKQQLWHANRSSYSKIMNAAGPKAGRNAVLFSWGFMVGFALCLFTIPGIFLFSWPSLLLFLPLAFLLLGPAMAIAFRAGKPALIPSLFLLYALYGFARMLDLLGLHRAKHSWKGGLG